VIPRRGAQVPAAALTLTLTIALTLGCAATPPATPFASSEAPAGQGAPADAGDEGAEPGAAAETPASPELGHDEASIARVEAIVPRMLGLALAFSNTSPSPVIRGYTQVPNVQFRSDRHTPGQPRVVEAPVAALHGPTQEAEKVEACEAEPVPGVPVSTRVGRFLVRREPEHDEVLVEQKGKLKPVKLPPGALHGACLDGDRRRLWVGWSTPERPAELFSISIRDGSVKQLRIDARPGLGALDEVRVQAGLLEGRRPFVALQPHGAPLAAVLLPVSPAEGPLARWDALARALADRGIATVRVAPGDVAGALSLARSLWGRPTFVLRRGPEPPAPAAGAGLLWLVGPDAPDAPLPTPPPGTLVVGEGEATRAALSELATRARGGAITWTVAAAPTPERTAALAWAWLADAALHPSGNTSAASEAATPDRAGPAPAPPAPPAPPG
jgi:hypothetical protein